MIRFPKSHPDLKFVDVEHPLSDAMDAVGLKPDWDVLITSLKPRKQPDQRSAIYRVGVTGTMGATVVAKRSRTSTATIERVIYEEILPWLPVTSPGYYGFAPEKNDEFCWLFLEYVDGVPLSPGNASHRRAAAHWLGHLHISATAVPSTMRLPDRGPDHYLRHLRSASAAMSDLAEEPDFASIRDLLVRLVDQLVSLEECWESTVGYSRVMPPTLAHGDFIPRNVRVLDHGNGPTLFPFDWELAGCGVPVTDLTAIDLDVYRRAVRRQWTPLAAMDLARLALIGRVFRCVASIDWSGETLQWGWNEKEVDRLRTYGAPLEHALRQLGAMETSS